MFLPEAEDLVKLGLWTELFFIAAYGYILFVAANMIGDGSDKLLLLYGPGLIGGLVIPILGAVPDGAIILVSGIGNQPTELLQKEIAIGVGTLAGSTIMLLTIPFGLAIFFGNSELDENGEQRLTKSGKPVKPSKFSWNNGVAVEETIPNSAK